MSNVLQSEWRKLSSHRWAPILVAVTIVATWLMATTNASAYDLPTDDPRLFSADPIPVEFQGFELAGFGYVLVIAFSALWAGSEYGRGGQIHTSLLAVPHRLRLFLTKITIQFITVALTGFLAMAGALMLTHLLSQSSISPVGLTGPIWARLGGVSLAWGLSGSVAFLLGTLARTAVVPLIVLTPLVIGLGDFLVGIWPDARFLPVLAGNALYSDPGSGFTLSPLLGGVVQLSWTVALGIVTACVFIRRDG